MVKLLEDVMSTLKVIEVIILWVIQLFLWCHLTADKDNISYESTNNRLQIVNRPSSSRLYGRFSGDRFLYNNAFHQHPSVLIELPHSGFTHHWPIRQLFIISTKLTLHDKGKFKMFLKFFNWTNILSALN